MKADDEEEQKVVENLSLSAMKTSASRSRKIAVFLHILSESPIPFSEGMCYVFLLMILDEDFDPWRDVIPFHNLVVDAENVC
ncbi:hypothetical protein [Geobacillus sp. C56-T2]|uniref:hypothetical protein n=1 Tax=Geobacillus sp. C56-T2 TaxID=600773 RepID=UPI0011A76D91|nr:hypothetical protein [Geobacillus sp. C56-T2]